MNDAALRLDRRAAGLCNHLVEAPVEPCQSIGDTVGTRLVRIPGGRPPGRCHPFELARQIVETIVDRCKIVTDRLFVVGIIAL